MNDRLFRSVSLVRHFQHHQVIFGGHEYKITVISSDELNLLVNCGKCMCQHSESLLDFHLSLFFVVGDVIEEIHISFHGNAKHRMVDLIHFRAGKELILYGTWMFGLLCFLIFALLGDYFSIKDDIPFTFLTVLGSGIAYCSEGRGFKLLVFHRSSELLLYCLAHRFYQPWASIL